MYALLSSGMVLIICPAVIPHASLNHYVTLWDFLRCINNNQYLNLWDKNLDVCRSHNKILVKSNLLKNIFNNIKSMLIKTWKYFDDASSASITAYRKSSYLTIEEFSIFSRYIIIFLATLLNIIFHCLLLLGHLYLFFSFDFCYTVYKTENLNYFTKRKKKGT